MTVMAVALIAAPAQDPVYVPVPFLAIHAVLLAAAVYLHRVGPRLTDVQRRSWRCTLFTVGLPAVFSTLGWILPAVHPEPYEWTWLLWDRALFGGADPTVLAESLLSPWFTEVLQWVYASFYLIPIAALAGTAVLSGRQAFDRGLTIVTFCFLVSYLGYLLWPTLPPYLYLDYDKPISGLWLATDIHLLLNSLEGNHWDCFPSGHTMLSLVSLILVWRSARRLLPVLVPVVVLMILSTVALRYHFVIDVMAGALLAWPSVRLCDWLLNLDTPEPFPGPA